MTYQHNVIPDVGCISTFTFIDWNGRTIKATILYSEKYNVEKIAINSSETNYFSNDELTLDQFIV